MSTDLLNDEASITSFAAMMKVFGISCLIVVEEGKGGSAVLPPDNRDQVLASLALYGEGELFHIAEEKIA